MIPMNDQGNKYALAALKERRGQLATEIDNLNRTLAHRKQMLVHVDATLHLLNPDIETDKIKNKRLPSKRVKLFRAGELGRMILDTMRRAGEPIGARAIADAILNAGGHGEEARKVVMPRVRSNLGYLERRGKVVKVGSGTGAQWQLR